ncbi:MAG: 50S ribosomal protein L15 [Ignavibacteria bacterium]|nr:50S ribosomal protein L15 [Ignavibacteria bacterium]
MTRDVLSTLKPASGSRRKPKRVGRGQGSGHGKTSTRGHNGQGSRAGATYRAWFEGGQMPLSRRVPKRGFNSPFRKVYQIVNVEAIQKLSSEGKMQNGVVTPEIMAKVGLVRKSSDLIKILGDGDLTTKLDVTAHAFSKKAAEKIEQAGGVTRIIKVAAKV